MPGSGVYQNFFKNFSHFFLDNRHPNLGDERNRRRKPEIDPPYSSAVSYEGKFVQKVVTIYCMSQAWEILQIPLNFYSNAQRNNINHILCLQIHPLCWQSACAKWWQEILQSSRFLVTWVDVLLLISTPDAMRFGKIMSSEMYRLPNQEKSASPVHRPLYFGNSMFFRSEHAMYYEQ